MKSVTRYKAVVIPRVMHKYVVVKDAKHNELTFVVGGCKLRETGRECALRELKEETRDVLGPIDASSLVRAFTFESRDRSEQELKADKRQNIHVTMHYTVYYLDLPRVIPFDSIRRRFRRAHPLNNTETDDIMLLTKRELLHPDTRVWRFMRQRVVPRLT